MLKKGLGLLIFILSLSSLGAQPKVAVLDASLGEGVPTNASTIVADTINEQFVKAPDYTAIDRVHISSVLEEMKFQLSGNVKEEDIKEIGDTFGADYLCVTNVNLLGSTYTVSARLIEVSTAEVYLQESHRMKGETDILFMIAEIVGAELVGVDLTTVVAVPLAGSTIEPEPAPQSESRAEAEPVTRPVAETQPEEQERLKPGAPRGHLMVSLMIPGYLGLDRYEYDSSPEGYYSLHEMDEFLDDNSFSNVEAKSFGIDIHYLEPFIKVFYYSMGFTFTRQNLLADYGGDSYEWENFRTFEPYAGFGVAFSPTTFLQLYGGMTAGLMVVSLGSGYEGDASDSFWGDRSGDAAAGMTLGFELGLDFYEGPFGLDLRYRLARCSELSGDDFFDEAKGDDRSFSHHGIMIGLGFMF